MSSSTRFNTTEDVATYVFREVALVAECTAGVDNDKDQPAINIDDKRLTDIKEDLRTALEEYREYCYNLAAGQRLATSHNIGAWNSEKEDAADWVLRTVKAIAETAAGFQKASVKRKSTTDEELEQIKKAVTDTVEHYHGACCELGELMLAAEKGEESTVETPFLDGEKD